MRDSRACVCSIGQAACSSGSAGGGWPAARRTAASSSTACTASASSLDSGILLPPHDGTTPLRFVALRT